MKGGFLLSLMCLIAGAHAYGYGGQTSKQKIAKLDTNVGTSISKQKGKSVNIETS